MSRSVLYLSYLFPPRGGAGVQRSLKFGKYLPEFGWRPLFVVNAAEASDRTTAVRDPSLLKDLPDDAVIRYTDLTDADRRRLGASRSKLRQRMIVTDPTGWWVEPAVRAGLELAERHKPAAILVTMSPFTSAEAGIRLKAATGLPLALDLRDPWALDESRIYPTRWHAWRDRRAMARALFAADLVIMNTPASQRAVEHALTLRPGARLTHITNGFDPEDFGHSNISPASPDTLRIVHTGMFHSELAMLWDDLLARRGLINRLKCALRPINLWTRTPRYLLAAIEQAIARKNIPPERIELVLVGEITQGDRALVEQSSIAPRVKMPGYQSHEQSVGWLQSAHALFLPNHTPLDGGPSLIVPGKTYEYLAAGRPILAMGPPGDMREFVVDCRAGIALGGDDVAGAADALRRLYEAKLAGRTLLTPDRRRIACFERRELARCLAGELDRLV